MPTRKPRNPELAQAASSLTDAARHVRQAVQGKIDEVRDAANVELAKAKAVALKKTGIAQDKVEAVLKKAEGRLHKVIAKAQKSLDKAVRQAEKATSRTSTTPAAGPAKTAAPAAAPGKAAPAKAPVAKKAVARKVVAKKAAARKPAA